VLTVDLHAGQIQGFFDIPTDNLFGGPVMIDDIKERFGKDKIVMVSPDVGGVVRARALANKLNADLAIVDKRRPEAGKSEVMNIIGEVKGARCIMLDDICDSGGTLANAAAALKEQGAVSVSAYVTHGVLSGTAVQRIEKSVLDELVMTDTIQPSADALKSKKIRVLPMSPLLGEAIRRIANEESVSKLFDR
jgi:ribose-phosphate pyrophosphokinase